MVAYVRRELYEHPHSKVAKLALIVSACQDVVNLSHMSAAEISTYLKKLDIKWDFEVGQVLGNQAEEFRDSAIKDYLFSKLTGTVCPDMMKR